MRTATSPRPRSATCSDLVLPALSPTSPTSPMVNISIGKDGLVTATFADGTSSAMGKVAMASFIATEGLRPIGDAHWQSTGDSGAAGHRRRHLGPLGAIRSGSLEHANVDITEELVVANFRAAQFPGECQGDRDRIPRSPRPSSTFEADHGPADLRFAGGHARLDVASDCHRQQSGERQHPRLSRRNGECSVSLAQQSEHAHVMRRSANR